MVPDDLSVVFMDVNEKKSYLAHKGDHQVWAPRALRGS
ncbi:hypothetical protein FOYG_10317 [Fusarium oxysporum NRRL 32931]|uniref:Uncharacterized protein n=1 Tax=Fusarium oxysporum NRRL 32931 TaxID=660029 RepID=W9I3S0_FUSOX|nr:hypothetical protein FOYG_10317 [Fusarium oxysporum NRRL 32931]